MPLSRRGAGVAALFALLAPLAVPFAAPGPASALPASIAADGAPGGGAAFRVRLPSGATPARPLGGTT